MQPNPATSHVNVSCAQGLVRRFRLLDINGRVVAAGNPAAQRFTIERNGLVPGTYLVELELENGRIDAQADARLTASVSSWEGLPCKAEALFFAGECRLAQRTGHGALRG